MSNKFCRFLSNGYSFQLDQNKLIQRPCCWYRGGVEFGQPNNFNEINTWTTGCQVCQYQEDAGQHSFRQASFDIIPDVDHTKPVALDINLDLTCNAACVICGPDYSSTWSKQMSNNNVIHIKANYDYQPSLDHILNSLDLFNLSRVKFFGGEPLLTDSHLQVLRKIPNPQEVELWYTTNASVVPTQEIFDIWSAFKLVYVEASIDGIDSQFDYLRWPLPWNKIQDNLFKMRSEGPTNILFRINHTLNPLNVYYYNRLEQWVADQFAYNKVGDPVEINIHPSWGTWALGRTPIPLRTDIYEIYPNHQISNMLKQSAELDYQPILNFTKTWDPIRKNDWQSAFPEIVKYFVLKI